jgi:hypothetical protein
MRRRAVSDGCKCGGGRTCGPPAIAGNQQKPVLPLPFFVVFLAAFLVAFFFVAFFLAAFFAIVLPLG